MKRKNAPNKSTKKADQKSAQSANAAPVQEITDADLKRVEGGLEATPLLTKPITW